MRLLTYERSGARRLGATVAGAVVDLPDAVGHPAFPRTMEELVAHNGGSILAAARSALDDPEAVEEFGVFHARLLTPLLPSSFVELAREAAPSDALSVPGAGTRTVMGPGDRLSWPPSVPYIGCHVEVGCIVGRDAHGLSARDAGRAVFGYTVMVGWSAAHPDGADPGGGPALATSLGPWIVTPDEVDLEGAGASVAIDGEVVATAVLEPTNRSFADLIAGASRHDQVGPGDIFGSTGFGASFELTMERRAAAGALVEVAVDGIGSLRTRIGR
jgi:2-keto-4-pentenoate hydratase/2-oxohepta-3-ene-1,7-dioic acid hydratase in catechol pathway